MHTGLHITDNYTHNAGYTLTHALITSDCKQDSCGTILYAKKDYKILKIILIYAIMNNKYLQQSAAK